MQSVVENLKIYNSLSGKKEIFSSVLEKPITIDKLWILFIYDNIYQKFY